MISAAETLAVQHLAKVRPPLLIPDAPADECGCPLYTSSTMLPPNSGVDCNEVCNAYTSCMRQGSDIQLGFTCDATLCTSSDHDLVFEACLGLQDCDLSEVFKAEAAAQCSCCASQLCNCVANTDTEHAIFRARRSPARARRDAAMRHQRHPLRHAALTAPRFRRVRAVDARRRFGLSTRSWGGARE